MYKYRPLHAIHANTYQNVKYMLIQTCTFQNRQKPINTNNTYHVYITYTYIQICTNTDHYIQYIEIHINTNNTC